MTTLPQPLPVGRAGIVATYGDPLEFVDRKDRWEAAILVRRELPFPIPYAYGPATVHAIRAHRLVVDDLVECLWEAHDQGVPAERLVYGGCYCWRPKRTNGTDLSTHTWAIAVDLDPAHNMSGLPWRDDGRMLHPTLVRCFQARGWVWGDGFPTPDPMHFQAATGY